ncbi:sensor histidine kinase [Paenibacillus sp. UMB4589-SE434]|uniref:sensor histidine kinase n=1 Tax=Paenibacillus sp. UMB4589-SE434 TaxID=3046314 RepID=UPI00254FF5FB|nr:sensor histidine kinase [Paenibacillus sp. UMB4589-SE434]MDK8183200.1 sensor histidine kinase [Paenibacillus sp. UMB4589-SE434]
MLRLNRTSFVSRLPAPRRSLRFKLVLSFLAAALVPLISLGLLSYVKSTELLDEQLGKYGHNAVTQLQYQLDAELSQLEMTAGYVHTFLLDPTRVVIGQQVPHTYAELQEQRNLEDFLKALKTLKYQGIYIVLPSGYYFGESLINTSELADQKWWRTLPESYAGKYWAGFYTSSHYISSTDQHTRLLGLVIPIRNQQGLLHNSRILIEMKADKLFELFHLFEKDTQAALTIRSQAGQVIYQSEHQYEPSPTDVVWTRGLTMNDWQIESRLPYDQFYQSSNVIRSFTIIGLVVAGLVALLLGYFFSSLVTGRIKRLKESMHLAGTGRLHTRVPEQEQDELGVLAHSFNRMVAQIQTLVEEIGRTEQQKKEAELRAFHYQINPHLLFNTLNTIQWKARLQGNEEIRRMLFHLTKLLEGNLDISQELVTLEQELTIIDHFLHIQRARYEYEFGYEERVDKQLLHYMLPRMSLQPLFENIFFHGFEDGQGLITLVLKEEGKELVLILQDDGKGIGESTLLRLKERAGEQADGRGLGVANVDQRFKLHFGPAYGLTIESAAGSGTTIIIRWPKRVGDKHDSE